MDEKRLQETALKIIQTVKKRRLFDTTEVEILQMEVVEMIRALYAAEKAQ